jgi:type III secretory pathway component EscV
VTALVLASFPIAFLIFAAIVGIPLWLVFKRPDKAPDYRHATASAKTAGAGRTAAPQAARKHAATRTPVPGRVHATAQRTVRSHETAAQRDRVPA